MQAEPANTASVSLELLVHEIEATPREHWQDLLIMLRQFRQKLQPVVVVNPEQAQKNQAAIDLLDSWLSDSEDAAEHQRSWDLLKVALDEDRLSNRPLFP